MLGLGVDPKELTFGHVAIRAITVFIVTLVMVRLGNRRFLSKMTAFDVILGFILASMLARAVNGSASFFPTLGGGFVLVGLHRLLAAIAFRSHRFSGWIKGSSNVLARDGQLDHQAMRHHSITVDDLLEEARLNGEVAETSQIEMAVLERNGKVSVIPKKNSAG